DVGSSDSGHNEEAISQSSESEELKPARPRMSPTNEEPSVPNKPLKFRLDKLERNHPYLSNRGLTQETVIDFDAGYCAKGMMSGRIAVPIHNVNGEVVAYVGRTIGEPSDENPKYKLPPGFKKSLELFNIDQASKESSDQPLIVVEGFFDCMKLHQLGHKRTVALMGSTMSPAQEELIKTHTTANSRVILMLDEDEAGQAGREDIAVRLSRFCFVKTHVFDKPNTQPEHLSVEEI